MKHKRNKHSFVTRRQSQAHARDLSGRRRQSEVINNYLHMADRAGWPRGCYRRNGGTTLQLLQAFPYICEFFDMNVGWPFLTPSVNPFTSRASPYWIWFHRHPTLLEPMLKQNPHQPPNKELSPAGSKDCRNVSALEDQRLLCTHKSALQIL